RSTIGVEALLISSLVNDALRALGLRRLVVLSPYRSNADIISYLAAVGFTVVNDVALVCPSAVEFEAVTPQRWLELARENDRARPSAFSGSCTTRGKSEAVGGIEGGRGRPVVNSTQAVLWGCLKRLKARLGPVPAMPNLGRLMHDLDA